MGGATGGGGLGGGDNFGEDGPECIACVQSLSDDICKPEFNTCFQFSSCQGWLSCTDDCAHANNSHDCYTSCDEAFLPSNSSNQNLKACACEATGCADVCPSLCTCGYLLEGNDGG